MPHVLAVGQRVYIQRVSHQRGADERPIHERLTEDTVEKVGRKWVTLSGHKPVPFRV